MASTAYLWVYTTCMRIPHICESIPPLRVYPHLYVSTPTSTCLHQLYVSTPLPLLPFLYVYTPTLCVYQLHVSIHLHMSTPPPYVSTPHPHVYSTSTCLFYSHMSTPISTCLPPSSTYIHQLYVYTTPRVYPPPHVYSTSICLLYIHVYILQPHVYPYLYVSTLALHIQPSFEHTVNSRMKTLFALAPSQRLLYS